MARQLILRAKLLAAVSLVALEEKDEKDKERYTLLHLADDDETTIADLKKSGLVAYDDGVDDQKDLPDRYKAGVIFGHEAGITRAKPKSIEP